MVPEPLVSLLLVLIERSKSFKNFWTMTPRDKHVVSKKIFVKNFEFKAKLKTLSCWANNFVKIWRKKMSLLSFQLNRHFEQCPVCCIHFTFLSRTFFPTRIYKTFYNRFFLLFQENKNVESRNDIFYESKLDTQFSASVTFILSIKYNFCVFGLGDINLFSTKCLH